MQKSQNENINTQAGNVLTNNSGNELIKQTLLQRFQDDVFKTIDEFYQLGGLEYPIKHLTGSLTDFFVAYDGDPYNDVDGHPSPLYMLYNKDIVIEKVSTICDIINFLACLKENFNRYEREKERIIQK